MDFSKRAVPPAKGMPLLLRQESEPDEPLAVVLIHRDTRSETWGLPLVMETGSPEIKHSPCVLELGLLSNLKMSGR